MGENSSIAWCHHTFNAWIGCARVSPGCEHCYAEAQAKFRTAWGVTWGVHGNRRVTSDANWKKPLRWNKNAEARGERARVFCSSLADVFEDRPELVAPRARLADLIVRTPWLDWQLLTKRPENILRLVPQAWRAAFPKHVWMGVTVEDQIRRGRVDVLRTIPAAVRFLSCEPQIEDLGTVDLTGIHWVIAGGESGGHARDYDLRWPRSLRDQCKAAGAAFFFKQAGARPVDTVHEAAADAKVRLRLIDRAGTNLLELPPDLRIQEFPRSAAA